ncbi:unnamed protein product [Orchesella dallaii]|uniref:THAP-type domain-containing protein n=1 Tax=Orchesella dallaii TaxID=48710 RepID=A0ABP1PMG9_9HEXA
MACYIPGCKSGNGTSSKDHLFTCSKSVSEEIKERWRTNVPKRKDKPFDISKCKICHLHFEENFIIKTSKVMLGTEIMKEEPRKKWQLTKDAYPTIFSSNIVPQYFDKKIIVRKPPKERGIETAAQKQTVLVHSEPDPVNTISKSVSGPETITDLIEPKTSIEMLRNIARPENWVFQEKENGVLFCKFIDGTLDNLLLYYVERSLEINEDFSFVAKMKSVDVSAQFEQPASEQDVVLMIERLSSLPICPGVQNVNMIKNWPSARKLGISWFSESCSTELVVGENICKQCSKLKYELLKEAARSLKQKRVGAPKPLTDVLFLARKKVKVAKVQVRRLKKKVHEMAKLQDQLQKSSMKTLEEAIQAEDSIPSQMKLTILTSLKYAKSKGKGMRYDSDWLLQALLIKIRSPKGYRQLRADEVIPLPHPNHLTQYLRGIPCQFGFNDFIFAELEKQFRDKLGRDCQIVLVFDEVKVQEAITFDKSTLKFQGFIDYAEFTGDLKVKPNAPKEADHCLVFMIQSLNSKMTQPIASFATRGAAPGGILAKMIVSCITRLENVNLQVVGVVCDGAATNKSAWKELGIGVKDGAVINKITNPADESRNVFFFTDVPHVLKCIRNNLLKKEIAMVRGTIFRFQSNFEV